MNNKIKTLWYIKKWCNNTIWTIKESFLKLLDCCSYLVRSKVENYIIEFNHGINLDSGQCRTSCNLSKLKLAMIKVNKSHDYLLSPTLPLLIFQRFQIRFRTIYKATNWSCIDKQFFFSKPLLTQKEKLSLKTYNSTLLDTYRISVGEKLKKKN